MQFFLLDLVLLDIKMPEMDGLHLYQEMKKIDNKVRVCFLKASEMYYEWFRQEKGFPALEKNLFLRRPIRNEDLLEQISVIMSQSE